MAADNQFSSQPVPIPTPLSEAKLGILEAVICLLKVDLRLSQVASALANPKPADESPSTLGALEDFQGAIAAAQTDGIWNATDCLLKAIRSSDRDQQEGGTPHG